MEIVKNPAPLIRECDHFECFLNSFHSFCTLTVQTLEVSAEVSIPAASAKMPHPVLSAEHCASGVSRAPPAVHGASAAGRVEVEQAWRPNPGYR